MKKNDGNVDDGPVEDSFIFSFPQPAAIKGMSAQMHTEQMRRIASISGYILAVAFSINAFVGTVNSTTLIILAAPMRAPCWCFYMCFR